jgi:hypothetical protein
MRRPQAIALAPVCSGLETKNAPRRLSREVDECKPLSGDGWLGGGVVIAAGGRVGMGRLDDRRVSEAGVGLHSSSVSAQHTQSFRIP